MPIPDELTRYGIPLKTKQHIDELRVNLRQMLEHSSRRVALLDGIRSRADKTATKEESRHLNAESGDYAVGSASDDIVALMLDVKAEKRLEKGLDYRPFLLKAKDLVTKWCIDQSIAQHVEAGLPFHYDFILKDGPHCSPLQVDFDGVQLRVFYIDAAGDRRNAPYAQALGKKHRDTERYLFPSGGIQFDHASCSVFSIQDLNNLTKLSLDEKKTLATEAIPNGLPAALAPAFIKNIQRPSKLGEYYELNKDKTIDKKGKRRLEQHLDDYSISVDISNASDKAEMRTQNHAVSYKVHKYLQAAMIQLDQLDDLEAERLIFARCDFAGKNTCSSEDESSLRQNMIDSVVKKKDTESIRRLISYAIQMDEPDLMTELLSLGADLYQTAPQSDAIRMPNVTPIHWAISKGNTTLVKQLLSCAPDKIRDCSGTLYFQEAITQYRHCPNTLDIMTLLVEQGADINAKNSAGETVLHQCTQGYNGDVSVLERLIELGANVDAQDNLLNTALH